MGAGMAANLVRAGHEVAVYNRSPDKAAPLVALGASAAGKVVDACRGDALITMLADDQAVESVAFGHEGVLRNLAAGAIHISMSTISVELSERLAATHAKAGQSFVAAPVFGRPDAAAAAAGAARADADLDHAIGLMVKHRALEDTIGRAHHYGAIARDALALFPDSAMKSALAETVDFCIARTH